MKPTEIVNGCELYLADCLDVLPTLAAGSVDLIFADLPYGTTDCAWDSVLPLDEIWKEYKRIIKTSGVVLLFGVAPFTAVLWQSNKNDWRYEWVWRKNGATRFLDAADRPLLDYENISVFYSCRPTYNPQKFKGEKTHSRGRSVGKLSTSEIYSKWKIGKADESGDKYPRLIIDFDKVPPSEILHPTQKPVELCEYLIKTYTDIGEVVLDNAMGSGTTGVACIQTGRRFIGIEKDPAYFAIACRRIAQAQPPLFVETPAPVIATQAELIA